MIIRIDNINSRFRTGTVRSPVWLLPAFLLLFCILTWFRLFDGYGGDFRPRGIHFWAQADRFSIARNYYDDGLNFFKPRTNYLEESGGLTGVEFPAIQYLSALIAKPFGARDQLFLIYRTLCFLLLTVGLQFLLQTVKMHGGNGFQQVLIPLFFLMSPVLLFYGFNLLPDIPSLALILISHHFFEKYRLRLGFGFIHYALLIGFGAALLKITSAIFPVAWFCWFLMDAIFFEPGITRRQIGKVTLLFTLGFLIWAGISYYFTAYANDRYQSSVFLSMSRHINRWTDFSDIWENVVCWHREYFRETQWWIILAGFLVSFTRKDKGILWLKGILLLGMAAFVLLMGKQLMHHDYYAICTIIPVVLIFSLDGLMMLSSGCLGSIILLYLVQQMAPYSMDQSRQRTGEVYNLPCREVWDFRGYMTEGHEWIEKNKIPENAVCFILYDYPLNTPLVYLDRKGMVIDHYKMKDKELVDHWFSRLKPDYVFIPSQWKDKLPADQPSIFSRLKLINEGKDVLIYEVSYH